MNKNILKTLTICAFALACSSHSMQSIAADMPYEPLFENASVSAIGNDDVSSMTPIQINNPTVADPAVANTAEANNLQSALMQLDSAQVEIRNQLIQYKSEYANLDNQFKQIKEQRAAKAKLVRETEKKIKNLDATKEQIRKNMN